MDVEFLLVTAQNSRKHRELLEQAYRLRHRVFVDEMGWEAIRRTDGREVDKFDTPDATHILALQNDNVVGYSRLLPTTKPNLLSEVYPHLAHLPIPCDPSIYEWTRYCVEPKKRGERSIDNVGSALLHAVMSYAFYEGIEKLSMQTDPIWLTRMADFGFEVDPLGLPTDVGGSQVVAMTVTLSARGLTKCGRVLRLRGSKTVNSPQVPTLPVLN
jgi:acyl-homoserine lactone synthase